MKSETPFAGCRQIEVTNDLLEALLVNRRRVYPTINPITSGGHSRAAEARHLLTYIVLSALHINRLPGHSDLQLKPEFFHKYPEPVLRDAIDNARRIYCHTQDEMADVADQIKLTRGLRAPESSVAKTLTGRCDFPLRLPVQSLSFFNHVKPPFDGEATLEIEAPIAWVWASAYTLKQLDISSVDEEFIVVPDSLDGCIEIGPYNLSFTESCDTVAISCDKSIYRDCLSVLFCDKPPTMEVSVEYFPGTLESLGRRLDKVCNRRGRATGRRKYVI